MTKRKELTRRDIAKAESRRLLIEAAAKLIREHGEDVNVRDICAAADRSTGALFASFASKDELVVAAMKHDPACAFRVLRGRADNLLKALEHVTDPQRRFILAEFREMGW